MLFLSRIIVSFVLFASNLLTDLLRGLLQKIIMASVPADSDRKMDETLRKLDQADLCASDVDVDAAAAGSSQSRARFECPVCFVDYFEDEGVIRCTPFDGTGDLTEKHGVCVDCLRGHARSALEDRPLAPGGVGLPCVVHECKNVLLTSEFEFYLEDDVHAGLVQRMQHESVAFAGLADLVVCPGCSAKFCVDLTATFYDCEGCSRRQCRSCPRPYDHLHQAKTCEQVQQQEALAVVEQQIGPRLSEIVVRVCPRCSLQFTKLDGCNKIICRCGALICYLCNVVVKNYDHFCQCGSRKVQQCPKCHKSCPLYGDSEAYDNQRMDLLKQKAGLTQ